MSEATVTRFPLTKEWIYRIVVLAVLVILLAKADERYVRRSEFESLRIELLRAIADASTRHSERIDVKLDEVNRRLGRIEIKQDAGK